MADANAPAGTGTPAATDTTTQTPAVPAPAAQAAPATPPAPAAPAPQNDAAWLKSRLEQNTKSVEAKILKDLGIADVATAKAAIAEANAKAAAAKTTEQKLAEAEARATAAEAQAATATSLLAEEVAAMLEELPADIQERVRAAGDSPLVQKAKIKELAELADSLGVDLFADKAEPKAAATTTAGAKPPPANTAPPPNAPPAAGATDTDHKAVYRQLEQENPVRAAAYLSKHVRQIYPAQ